MENFNFYSPTYFEFGKEKENLAGKLVKRFGGTKILIHYGSGSVVRSGLLQRVKTSLEKENIEYVELGGVMPNPRSGLVYEGIELCRKEKVDFILAVGGGSAIDSAKAIAIGVPYEGDFWDFYQGKRIEKALPVATVLTLSAAGSEASLSSVITHENGMVKRGTGSDKIRPVFSILNPALTQTLPPYQTSCGATDMFAHVLERYFTNTRNVEITDRLCEGIMLTIINEARKELNKKIRKAEKEVTDAEMQIAALEAEIKQMELQLQQPGIASDGDFVISFQKKQRELEQKLYEWEILSETLEELKNN